MKKIFFLHIVLSLFVYEIVAQQTKIISNSYSNNSLLFPSNNSLIKPTSFQVCSKVNLIGNNLINYNFASAQFSIINEKAKIGINFINTQQNILAQNAASLNLTYHIKYDKGLFATSLGLTTENSQLKSLNILDPTDPDIPANINDYTWNSYFNYGFTYQYQQLILSFSGAKFLNKSNSYLFINEYNNQNFLAIYKYKLDEKNCLETMVLLRNINDKIFINDYNFYWNTAYNLKFGLGYRSNQIILSSIDIKLNQVIKQIPNDLYLVYTFDYSVAEINSFISNEIMLRYMINSDRSTKKLLKSSPQKSPIFLN